MALSISESEYNLLGNRATRSCAITFDSSYVTGGEAFDPEALFGIRDVDMCLINPAKGRQFVYDSSNKKILAYGNFAIAQQAFLDLRGSANTDALIADGGALPTNGAMIVAAVTQADVTTATGVLTVAASPDVARNLCVCVTNDSGGALNLYVGSTTIRIVGTYKGAAQTEDILVTVTNAQKSVANGKFRYVYGLKPFDTVTAVTQPGYVADAMAAALKISVGLGSKVALYNGLATGVEADILKITKNYTDLAPTALADLTYNTVNLGAVSDNGDAVITYKTKAMTLEEVASGTDLSGITTYAFIIGI